MTATLRHTLRAGQLAPGFIEKLLEEQTFPLIEDTTATFVYRGHADAVMLRHWVFGLPTTQAFERVPGTDLWYFVLELPAASRVEYKLEIVHGQDRNLIRDPLNPNEAHDPFGSNSVCFGVGYETPDWIEPDENAREGTFQELDWHSDAFGDQRHTRVYLPPRMTNTRRYPLLIVHDGDDYVKFAALKTVLDNLIGRFEIPQIIVALTSSPNRVHEYAADERHGDFIVNEMLPRLEAEFPLRPEAAARGLMGASFGGIASLATAWRHPGVFGRLLLQSGSFAFTDIGDQNWRGPLFDPVVKFMNQFRDDPGKHSERLFISCGMYESLIYENRSMIPLLQGTGMDVRYVESRDGHNWENWRDRLREGLSWLFPGPLWMMYE